MDAKYLNPIISATDAVFQTMLSVEPEKGNVSLQEDLVTDKEANVIIGMTGDVKGSIVYSFSEDNHIVVRADVIDFWRLAVDARWQLDKHYMLYPNPYPKKTQLQKRWHGHPAFLSLLALGGTLIQRSNWQLYLHESAHVLAHFAKHAEIKNVVDSEPFTPFERKYSASGQTCWELVAKL